ncbi:MAG: CDP-alcohol phosphatidyltransferase family protein [Candidatus Aenigmarchaeota archaeon]|nr:CDP-alcohol phosphatidyltransferase family protein [Candidatus Aenigmarchaeota archaeon]
MEWRYPITKYFYRKFSKPTARLFYKLGFEPNQVTILSFILGIFSAIFLSQSMFIIGLVILFVSEVLDCVDGDLARMKKKVSKKGEFLDSFLDRIVEIFLFYGLIFTNPSQLMLIGSLALILSLLVTYVRSKAEVVGVSCEIGIASRDVRMLIMMVSILLVPFYSEAIYWAFLLVVVLSFVTVVQRFFYSYAKIKDVKKK